MRLPRLAAWIDPRGRLSRRAYGRAVVRLLAASAALVWAAIVLGAQGWRPAAVAAFGGVAVLWLAGLALTIRRLHDRGRTGWWVALAIGLSALSAVPVEEQTDAHPVAVTLYALATLAAWSWLLVETLGRRGTRDRTDMGRSPAAADSQDVRATPPGLVRNQTAGGEHRDSKARPSHGRRALHSWKSSRHRTSRRRD